MIKNSIYPKYAVKYSDKDSDRKVSLPERWVEFARLCDIRSGASIVKFDPYQYQIELVDCIDNHQTTVITKTRQLGITETIANYFLFHAATNPGYLAVIFSKTQADTSNIAKRIRRQIDSLYEYIETKTDSLTDIQIKNGGRLLFRNASPNGARGLESVSHILYDEASFIDEIEEIYKSSIPCTTTVGDQAKIIILSTPNGQSGWYFDKLNLNNGNRNVLEICDRIRNGELEPKQYWTDDNGWCKFILHWKAHPIFGEKTNYLDTIKKQFELPMEVVNQEYDLSFSDGESLVFSSELVRKCAIGQFESPVKDAIYYCGLDSSLFGNDYTVLTVLKEVENGYSLVAMYRQRKQTHQYNIFEIGKILDDYKPLYVGVEVNSAGQVYFDELKNQHFNISFQEIKTTQSSKQRMVNRLTLALEREDLIFPDKRQILQEFLSFRQKGNKLEAVEGQHDDIVMSLCFALQACHLV